MKPLRVLIVEDDLTIGPLLAETLEQLGHVVCGLEVDAAAAVDAARRCHPDLMIVDIGLGEASGIAAVEQILKEGFVPHVFVTGDGLRGLPLGPEVCPDSEAISKFGSGRRDRKGDRRQGETRRGSARGGRSEMNERVDGPSTIRPRGLETESTNACDTRERDRDLIE